MNGSWQDLPPVPREIATALSEAVAAAMVADPVEYDAATVRLAHLDGERVGLVAGETVRLMLEDAHPDGLDTDDLHTVLERTVRATVGWYPELDAGVLGALLAAALGVHESDGQPITVPADAAAGHAPLLVADLATVTPHPADGYLRAALDTITTTQTMDLP